MSVALCARDGGRFAAHLTALLFGVAAPNSGVLVGLERELKTLVMHATLGADRLGLRNLEKCLARGADGKEEFGIGVAADRLVAPGVVGVSEGER